MVERLRSTKPKHCSEGAWHNLLLIMNSKPATILPSIDELDEVIQCHARAMGQNQYEVQRQHLPSIVAVGRKYYAVDRMQVFAFVQVHGEVCPRGRCRYG